MVKYLSTPDAERLFNVHASAYALSLLEPQRLQNNLDFSNWSEIPEKAKEQTLFTEKDFVFRETFFGTWVPRPSDPSLKIYAGISMDQFRAGDDVAVCAVLDDDEDRRADGYEKEWNGMLQFSNVMQFNREYIALSKVRLEGEGYPPLPYEDQVSDAAASVAVNESASNAAWKEIKKLLFENSAKLFADAAADAGIPAPPIDCVGYEVEGDDGGVLASVELAWPDKKIGFLTETQLEDKEKLEQKGWTVIDMSRLSEAAEMFGGKGK